MTRILSVIVLVVGLVVAASLYPSSAQEDESPYDEALRAVVDLFNEGAVEVVETTFSSDIVIHYLSGNPDREGIDSLIEWVMVSRTIWPDFTLTFDDYIVQNDMLAARWTVNGTHTGEVPGIPPTGNEVEFRGMLMLRFDDGQIAEWWHADDELSILTQLGVIPPQETME